MKHLLILPILILVCPALLQSQSPSVKELSLTRAIEIALNHSPQYKASKKDVAVARGEAIQSGLWDNPKLFAGSEEWPIERSYDEARYMIGLSQTIPFPGKKSLERKAGERGEEAAKAAQQFKKADLIKEVRIFYYRVLLTKKVLEISRELLGVAKSSVETARERLNAGDSTPQEVLRAEIQYERVKSNQAQYLQDYNVSRSKLVTLMGSPNLTQFTVLGRLRSSAPVELLELPKDDAWLSNHPLIKEAESKFKQDTYLSDRSDLEIYPDVTLQVSGGQRRIEGDTLVDFRLSIPLPLIDRSRGRRVSAHALADKARLNLLSVKQSLKAKLQQGVESLSQIDKQVRRYRTDLLPRSEKALFLVQTGFKEGEFAFNDLLDTQRTLAETRLVYQLKVFQLNEAIAEVESLLKPDVLFSE